MTRYTAYRDQKAKRPHPR